jgi:hypothetical protein
VPDEGQDDRAGQDDKIEEQRNSHR